MEYFVAHRANNLPADAFAEIFDRLIWCLDDNGDAISAVTREWLQSTDEYKVEIVLSMNDQFPFPTRAQMEEHLPKIALRFPRLREKCTAWLDQAKTIP